MRARPVPIVASWRSCGDSPASRSAPSSAAAAGGCCACCGRSSACCCCRARCSVACELPSGSSTRTTAVSVARLTEAACTAASFSRRTLTRLTHPAQRMPAQGRARGGEPVESWLQLAFQGSGARHTPGRTSVDSTPRQAAGMQQIRGLPSPVTSSRITSSFPLKAGAAARAAVAPLLADPLLPSPPLPSLLPPDAPPPPPPAALGTERQTWQRRQPPPAGHRAALLLHLRRLPSSRSAAAPSSCAWEGGAAELTQSLSCCRSQAVELRLGTAARRGLAECRWLALSSARRVLLCHPCCSRAGRLLPGSVAGCIASRCEPLVPLLPQRCCAVCFKFV